jgi:hypothetical protein
VDLGLKNFSNPICLLHTQKSAPGPGFAWFKCAVVRGKAS